MNSFKDIAYQILKMSGGPPLHSKEITKLAMEKGKLHTEGKTPWATMNAALVTDVNTNGAESRFSKTGPSTFAINKRFRPHIAEPRSVRTPIPEEFVKHSIVKYLSCQGWGFFKYGGSHVHGVDIRAKKQSYSRYIYIETKGSSTLRQSDETGFIYCLGQVITRMKDSGTTRNYYGIGLPDSGARIAIRRVPWQVAKKLLLSIYSVTVHGEVEEFSWAELKKAQASISVRLRYKLPNA